MNSKRFEPIREIAANSADELRAAMGEAERRVMELERQLQQLNSYRDDYMQKAAGASGPIDTVRLQNTRSFLDRLADASRLHLQNLGVARAELEARRTQWSQKHIEAESLGRAVERFRNEERRVADRREQTEGDERALWLTRSGGASDST